MINKKITTSGIELSSKIEEYIDKKIATINKFVEDTEAAQVNIRIGKTVHHQKGDVFSAEMDISFGKNYFRAEAQAGDLFSAIDIAKDDLTNDIAKSKSKHQKLFKRGHQKIKDIIKRLGRKS